MFVWKEENNAFVKRIEDKDPEHYQKFDFQSDKEEISVTINFHVCFSIDTFMKPFPRVMKKSGVRGLKHQKSTFFDDGSSKCRA